MPRKYSLFEKRGRYWVRISTVSLYKNAAVQFFQGSLLAYAFGEVQYERSLRPVKE